VVAALKPTTLVELGTHTGNSYSAFCQTVQSLQLNTACFAVDTWRGDTHAGEYGDEVFTDYSSFHDQHFGAFSRLIRGTFDQALPHFSPGHVDLLHIDGCHTYEAVRHDFESWRPKLSSCSVVLFHDTNVRERDFGVWRFWEEISSQFPSFNFLHGHGLGVLATGNNIPRPIQLLTSKSLPPEDLTNIRSLFSQLGNAVLNSYDCDFLTRQQTLLQAKLQELSTSHAQLQSTCTQQKQVIESLSQQLERAKSPCLAARILLGHLKRGLFKPFRSLSSSCGALPN
jgi:hypothetical protein